MLTRYPTPYGVTRPQWIDLPTMYNHSSRAIFHNFLVQPSTASIYLPAGLYEGTVNSSVAYENRGNSNQSHEAKSISTLDVPKLYLDQPIKRVDVSQLEAMSHTPLTVLWPLPIGLCSSQRFHGCRGNRSWFVRYVSLNFMDILTCAQLYGAYALYIILLMDVSHDIIERIHNINGHIVIFISYIRAAWMPLNTVIA